MAIKMKVVLLPTKLSLSVSLSRASKQSRGLDTQKYFMKNRHSSHFMMTTFMLFTRYCFGTIKTTIQLWMNIKKSLLCLRGGWKVARQSDDAHFYFGWNCLARKLPYLMPLTVAVCLSRGYEASSDKQTICFVIYCWLKRNISSFFSDADAANK